MWYFLSLRRRFVPPKSQERQRPNVATANRRHACPSLTQRARDLWVVSISRGQATVGGHGGYARVMSPFETSMTK
jgi:hypothetical protein